jgi:heat shock protein HtpX
LLLTHAANSILIPNHNIIYSMQESPLDIVPPPTREQPCPACGATIPVYAGYVTWCDRCNWNVKPRTQEEPKSPFEKIHAALGKRFGKHLYDKVIATERIEPELNGSKVAAFALATAVHGVTIAFALAGIYAIVAGWPNILMIFLGVLSLLIAFASRPRPGKPEKSVASRESFPELYRIVDTVAEKLGAPKVDVIVLDTRVNASYGVIGWRRRRELWLGIPLVAMLNGPEFLALIGHELGHSINRDSTRGFYLDTAIRNLALWYRLIRPAHLLSDEAGASGIFIIPFNVVMMGLAQLPRWGATLMAQLVYRDSQRAEYLADYLATVAAGKESMMAMLDKLHLHYIFEYSVQYVAVNRNGRTLFAELAHQLAALPPRELERVRRVGMMEDSALDATHPLTHFRINFLMERGESRGCVPFSDEEWARVSGEMKKVEPAIERYVLERYQWSLHQ